MLEIKGVDDDQNRAKRSALAMWVKGVNQRGGFGIWAADVAFEPAQIHDVVEGHAHPPVFRNGNAGSVPAAREPT